MKKKPILAFDCALIGASIAVLAEGKAYTRTLPQSRQAAELIPAIEAVMAEAGASYQALECIISTTGPGSFTGLRIGLAALHGLALVAQTPIKTLTTLEAMAWETVTKTDAPEFLVALKAGKGELAAQAFTQTGGHPQPNGEVYLVPETFTDWPLPCYGNHLPEDSPHHLAGVNTELLCRLSAHLPTTSLAEAVPFYIRPPDAAIPKPFAWLASSQ